MSADLVTLAEVMEFLERRYGDGASADGYRWRLIDRYKAQTSGALSSKDEVRGPSELESHRADWLACRNAGWESPGELLSAYKTQQAEIEKLREYAVELLRRINKLSPLRPAPETPACPECERLRAQVARLAQEVETLQERT